MAEDVFNSDGTFTVPAGVEQIDILCAGGEGGEGENQNIGSGGNGGLGSLVEGTLTVSPGETLYVRVNDDGGTGGSTPAPAGNGGGSADVRRGGASLADRIIVAGGGGGGAANDQTLGDGKGGAGGLPSGSSGEDGTGTGGGGGTQTAGGTGPGGAQDGSLGAGGDGDSGYVSGGGGGGGYYGGGGGGADGGDSGGGGGGGSSYVGGVDGGTEVGVTTGHRVEIVYDAIPSPPENITQTVAGDDEINLDWDQGDGTEPDDYTVEVSKDGGSFTVVATVTNTSYTYTASPDTNIHEFRVRASSTDGSSDWSYTETVATEPTNPSVTGTAQSQISLAWDGVRDATGYEVLRAESSGSAAADYTAVATPSMSPYTDTGLEDGEQYYYRVRAAYPGTPSQPTGEVDATTPLPAPTIDALDATTAREIVVEYTLPDNSTDGDLTIERSEDDGATWAAIATVTDLSATTYTDTGLLDGTGYTYRLTRDTGDVSVQSGEVSAQTILPAPTNLEVVDVRDDEADIQFRDNANNKQGYRVEVAPDKETLNWTQNGDDITDTVEEGETINYTLSGLRNGEAYVTRASVFTEDTEVFDN